MSQVTEPRPSEASGQSFSETAPNGPHLEFVRTSRLAIVAIGLTTLSLGAFVFGELAVFGLAGSAVGLIGLLGIRKHPNELTGKRLAVTSIIGGPVILVGSIVFHQTTLMLEVPENYQLISWRELEPNEATPQYPVSTRAQELAGEDVYIRGYVYPSVSKTNLKRFILVRDSGSCCFGGQPKLTDMIVVDFKSDDRVNYSYWPRGIGGTFRVKPPVAKFKDVQTGAYHIEADHLK